MRTTALKLITSSLLASQRFENNVLRLNPTLYLPMQESAGETTYQDLTYNGHDAIEKQAGHQTNGQTGGYGRLAVKFDGTSLSGLTIPETPEIAMTASGSEKVSVMCLFKANGNGGYLVTQDNGGNRPWVTSVQDKLYGYANNQSGPGLYTDNDYRSDGKFHLFIATMDDGTNECKHYVDGLATTVLGGTLGPFQATNGSTPIQIGTNVVNDFRFDGWISDVAVWYGGILTEDNVAELYKNLIYGSGSAYAYRTAVLTDAPSYLWVGDDASGDFQEYNNGPALTHQTGTIRYRFDAITAGELVAQGSGSAGAPSHFSTTNSGPPSAISGSEWTMECLFRQPGGNDSGRLAFYIGDSSSNGAGIYVNGPSANLPVLGLLGGVAFVGSSTNISKGPAHHLVLRRKAGVVSLWVDGVSVATSSSTPNAPSNVTEIYPHSDNANTYGTIAFTAVYNSALSDARIAIHAAAM